MRGRVGVNHKNIRVMFFGLRFEPGASDTKQSLLVTMPTVFLLMHAILFYSVKYECIFRQNGGHKYVYGGVVRLYLVIFAGK